MSPRPGKHPIEKDGASSPQSCRQLSGIFAGAGPQLKGQTWYRRFPIGFGATGDRVMRGRCRSGSARGCVASEAALQEAAVDSKHCHLTTGHSGKLEEVEHRENDGRQQARQWLESLVVQQVWKGGPKPEMSHHVTSTHQSRKTERYKRFFNTGLLSL